jgi:hypothetical protein
VQIFSRYAAFPNCATIALVFEVEKKFDSYQWLLNRYPVEKNSMYRRLNLAVLLLAIAVVVTSGRAVAAPATNPTVASSSLGEFSPTFVGPAATGCTANGCSLLTGPFYSPSTEPFTVMDKNLTDLLSGRTVSLTPREMPEPKRPHPPAGLAPDAVTLPSVGCEPMRVGCDKVDDSSGGAVGVKGLDAVDSGSQATNLLGLDIEPADQGLCAGNGYVVESNNVGEVLVFNEALQRRSAVIPLDTLMGLTGRGWSSGGDISCVYDHDNGGHWFFTQIVSASSEAEEGPFGGCFAGVANACYEGIAVTQGSSPFGPYSVYFLAADYNPAEPGYPYLLNDFAKIAVSRDAFLIFYDEFPLVVPGLGGGGFNGAQEFAFNKNAMEQGLPVNGNGGVPNPAFTVAIENMGLLPTPNGTCFSDDKYGLPGFTCWYSVIPTHPPDPSQFDNSHGGSGFMLEALDFYGNGDTRIAVFDWTGLSNLNSPNCSTCSAIQFGGQLFSNVQFYYAEGSLAEQKTGPTPLGDECGAAGLSTDSSCPESGIATNGDNFTQASQAQQQLWGSLSTLINQTYSSSSEVHFGAAYWVIGTQTFDKYGYFSLSSQGYVSPKHEELEFPTIAASGSASQDGGNDGAIITFSLSGTGGAEGVHNGGFYPSTAYGRLSSSSNGLLDSAVNIVDLGQSPQDGFTEYDGYPGGTRARWGDYSSAVFAPWSGGKIFFATNYIEYTNCLSPEFTLTLGTCDGTRDGFANWGTSVNFVVP